MKSYIEGNAICLTNDDFDCLATSNAVFCTEFRELASALALSCEIDDVNKRQIWLYPNDFQENQIGFKEGGKILKVTIEWVDEPEGNNIIVGADSSNIDGCGSFTGNIYSKERL